jgi:hypothetical protein
MTVTINSVKRGVIFAATFRIGQGRLGAGRIHHRMRLKELRSGCSNFPAGAPSRASPSDASSPSIGRVLEDIAKSFAEIEQARLLRRMARTGADDGARTRRREAALAVGHAA